MSPPNAGRLARIRKPLSMMVLSVLSLVLIAATPPVRYCKLAGDWVKANARSLPQTRTEIQKYAAPWRRAIFAKLSPEVRTRLSREHLSDVLANGTLTAQQRALVVEVGGSVDRMQRLTRQEAESEIVVRWMPRIQQSFPGDRKLQTSRLFYQVFGDPGTEGLSPKVMQASLVPGFLSLYIRKLAQKLMPSVYSRMVECGCHGGSSSECGIFDCSTQGTCTVPDCLQPPCFDGQCY